MSIKSRILDFVEQPDINTCQAAAIARVIGTTDVWSVRHELLDASGKRGTASGDPYVMGAYLRDHVESYEFIPDASLYDAKKHLEDGAHLITHGWFTNAGHVIGLSPFEDGDAVKPHPYTGSYCFNAEDSWYEFDFKSWTFTRRSGNNVPYSAYGIYAACVASYSRSQASAIYRRGELDSGMKNMWLHVVHN